MGPVVPPPPQLPADRAGYNVPGPRRLRLARQQRSGGDETLRADDIQALRPCRRADSEAEAGADLSSAAEMWINPPGNVAIRRAI